MSRNVLDREKGINSRSLEMLGDQAGKYKGVGEKMGTPKGWSGTAAGIFR